MSQLIELAQPYAELWSASLWRASLEGGIAIAVAWVIARWCKFLSPRVMCWIWRMVCLKLLVALYWAQPLAIAILPQPAAAVTNGQTAAPNAAEFAPVAGEARTTVNGPLSISPAELPKSHITMNEVLALVWVTGVLLFVIRTVREWLFLRRMRRNTVTIAGSKLQQLCQCEAARLGVRRMPPIRLSSKIDGPLLMGFVRPTILLPDSAEATFDDSDLSLMLGHELAHLKRRDLNWNWLPTVVGWLFFFHPFTWLLRRGWFESQEAACDELLLQNQAVSPSEYGRLLLKLSAHGSQMPRASLAAAGVLGA